MPEKQETLLRTRRLYQEAVFDTDRERALQVIREAVDQGVTPEEIVFDIVTPAIEHMVQSISDDYDANLAQHFMAAEIASEVTAEMIGRFRARPAAAGRVVFGTAEGDLHSLGKRIVIGCLKTLMLDVTDLGVNVPPEQFVDAAVARDAHVIGISAMMSHTARGENGCMGVRRLLRERRLEDRIRIVVGGAPYRFDSDLYRRVGADAWAPDGITAGNVIVRLVKEMKQ